MSRNEFRVIGPPGTGKTTYLSHNVRLAVDAGRRPLITSLTRAAAAEIASRVEFGWDFSADQVGTLHSHARRAIGHPEIVGTAEQIEDWNKTFASNHDGWTLSLAPFGKDSQEDGRTLSNYGDATYLASLTYRAMMLPKERWPNDVRNFHDSFSSWKTLNNLHDFTDLVEICNRDVDRSPINPDLIFVDEAQDHDRLELSLIRKWSRDVEQLVVCGDPDQNLYEWRGAEPDAFFATEIPPENYRVLKQSYRVPQKVHSYALKMIRRITERKEFEYLPKVDRGQLIPAYIKLKDPTRAVDAIIAESEKAASVMVLASCEYQLGGIIKQLRNAGVPFHNPFSDRGQFNPLSDRGGVSSPQRLLAFLRSSDKFFGEAARLWTYGELDLWLDPIKSDGLLRRGAKKKIETMAAQLGEVACSFDKLREFFSDDGISQLEEADSNPVGWYVARLNASRQKPFEFPSLIVERQGVKGLTERPKIIVGTIHSVKGGEAESVFVFPDLSPQAFASHERNPAPTWRQYYVALTRASSKMFICENSTKAAIRW